MISITWVIDGSGPWEELLENHYRIGLIRMERAIKEKMSMQEVDAMMPHDLVNPQTGVCSGQGIFWHLAAVPVHGPDQPIVGNHP